MSYNKITLIDVMPDDIKYYCPISVKDEMNPPSYNIFDNMKNAKLFLSNKNVNYMIYAILALNNVKKPFNGLKVRMLKEQMPKIMYKWAVSNKVNNATEIANDITQTLEFLNKRFLNDHRNIYNNQNPDVINVFRSNDTVTDECGNETIKRYDEMLATDYHTLNLWDDESRNIFTNNGALRDCNRIPVWQTSMAYRPYDLSNDGLRVASSNRASLETPIYKYDMTNIIKGDTSFENYYYENM